jgi:hypothetical protein
MRRDCSSATSATNSISAVCSKQAWATRSPAAALDGPKPWKTAVVFGHCGQSTSAAGTADAAVAAA